MWHDGLNCDFRRKSPFFVSETVRDRPMVATERGGSICVGSDDLDGLLKVWHDGLNFQQKRIFNQLPVLESSNMAL